MKKMSVDSAILEALGLDAQDTKQTSHGGAGFSSTFKLTSVKDGKNVNYFIKTGTGKDAEIMFRGRSYPFIDYFPLTSVANTAMVIRRACLS